MPIGASSGSVASRRCCAASVRWMRCSISRTLSRYSSSRRLVARPEAALEIAEVLGHRVEDAGVLPGTRHSLRVRAGTAEQALEHDARVDLHRHRRGLRRPRDGVHVGAGVARAAAADVAVEVLGRHLDRRERRVAADLLARSPDRPSAQAEVLPLGLLGDGAAQPRGRRGGVAVVDARAIQVADDDQVLLERLERLQDRREVEAGAGLWSACSAP